jgi:hypothetical protein
MKLRSKSAEPGFITAKEEAKNQEKNKREKSEENKNCEIEIDAMQWGLYRPGHTDLVINGRFEELH